MRTAYDLEMMREVGFCSGIENYSRYLDGREAGEPPYTLLDYFPDDFMMVLDESHVTVPQIHGQYAGDRSRKDVLVDHGFRLPSAMDNRPLTFEEWYERANQVVLAVGDSGEVGAGGVSPGRRADHPAHRTRRSRGRGPSDQGADRRSGRRGAEARRSRSARPGDNADEEDGRGPQRLPARDGSSRPLPAFGHRHPGAGPDPARLAAGGVRRPDRREPAARGLGSARGVARRDPRRRQGGVPAIGDQPDPDHGPRRPQRRRPGRHVRRQRHRLDAAAINETNRRRKVQIDYNEAHGIDPQTIRKKVSDILELLQSSSAPAADRRVRETRERAPLDLPPTICAG